MSDEQQNQTDKLIALTKVVEEHEKQFNKDLSYIEKLFEAKLETVSISVSTLKESTSLAQQQILKHQDQTNNITERLNKNVDTANEKYLSKESYEDKHEPIVRELKDLELKAAKNEGKASMAKSIAWVSVVVTTILSILTAIHLYR
jgi:hypothetical protein